MKIVLNHGVSGCLMLSNDAEDMIAGAKGLDYRDVERMVFDRDDSDLVDAVEMLSDGANGEDTDMRVVEIPDGVKYWIRGGGYGDIEPEHIVEKHRVWRAE